MSDSHDQDNKKQTRSIQIFGLIIALLLGSFVRFVHVLTIEYPLNDGGFFLALIEDLRKSSTILPAFTSYNQFNIPFAYPPLAIFITDILSRLLGISVIDLIRLFPPFISCLTIPAFYVLARRLLSSTIQVIAATITFALLPTAFDWLIVGAGLTRSFGYLFAILTLIQIHSVYTADRKRHILWAILFASLTILSHPGTAWFAFYSGGVLFLYFFRYGVPRKSAPQLTNNLSENTIISRLRLSKPAPGFENLSPQRNFRTVSKSTFIVLGTAILTSPWWITMIRRHGFSVFLYPYQTESFSISALVAPLSLLFTNEPLVDILAVIGFLGLLVSLRERKFLIPAWLAAVFIFEPRLSAVYAALPMAMLVGIGLDKAILPLVSRSQATNRIEGKLPKITLGFLLFYALISAYIAPQYNSLSHAQVDSMAWIRQHTSKDSTFLILTGNESYGNDYTSEWFPAFGHRHSLTTVQGHEWLPDKEFSRRVALHAELQTYVSADATSLESWAQDNHLTFSYIFIAKKALAENKIPFAIFQDSLENSSTYELSFENRDTLIFAKHP